MALSVSATTMALLLLCSLVAVSHCGALQAESATNVSSSYGGVVVVHDKVHAVQDAEGLLRLPSSVAEPDPDRSLVEPVAEPDPDRSPVEPVAEPDPDQSLPDSDDLATSKACSEAQQGDGMANAKEHIGDEDKDEDEEKEKANKKKERRKKTKKHHDGDNKGKKEKAKKQHRQSDDEDKEEENTKKRIYRHHRAEESAKKKNKLLHHINKNNKNSDDSDDDDEEEKKVKRWRKAIKSRFGHGRRSQREEKVNN